MNFKSLRAKLMLPQRISYKLFVTICISLLLGFFMVIMVINSFLVIRANSLEMSEKEAQLTTDHMATEIENKLESLRQYYLYSAMDEDIEWFLNNKLDYSDYEQYKKISAAIGNNALFPNYINSYVIVNNNAGKVISSKGIYDLKEMINKEEVLKLYEDNSTKVHRGNWVYISGGTSTKSLDHGYRLTCDTAGLNYIMNLPIGGFDSKGFLLVNLNIDEWKRMIWENVGISGKEVVVINSAGDVIYSTNSEFAKNCRDRVSYGGTYEAFKMSFDNKNYIVAESDTTVLGWKYYVAYDYNAILSDTSKLLIEFLIAIAVLATLSFITVRYAIYHPVEQLMKEVSEQSDTDVKGNELVYLAGQFENLRHDKEALNQAVNQKKEKLSELFEMRIIRSAISTADEWDDYIKVLNLTEHSYYAVIAIVLNLKNEEDMEDEINEDAICLSLAENLPESLKKIPWLPLIYDSCTLTCIFASESEEELMSSISAYYEEFKNYARESCGYSIQMGISEIHTMRNHIGRAYHECIYALTMDVEDTGNTTNNADEQTDSHCRYYIKPKATGAEGINLKMLENELSSAMKDLDKGACYRLLDEFTDSIRLVGDWSISSVYLSSVVDIILLQALDMQIEIASLWPEGVNKLYQSIVESGDVSRIRKNLKKLLIDPIFKERLSLLEDQSYQMMAKIEEKLERTKGNITLNECADELNVTPTYIWKIMKAERGKTFSEYQEEYKIEEAKKLLQTNKSVSDIAKELGYTNAQNFIRFFSKETGLTPGKYRKLTYGSL